MYKIIRYFRVNHEHRQIFSCDIKKFSEYNIPKYMSKSITFLFDRSVYQSSAKYRILYSIILFVNNLEMSELLQISNIKSCHFECSFNTGIIRIWSVNGDSWHILYGGSSILCLAHASRAYMHTIIELALAPLFTIIMYRRDCTARNFVSVRCIPKYTSRTRNRLWMLGIYSGYKIRCLSPAK